MNDLMVMAGAGTGKTTTMEWAWKTGKGQVCPFTPTDEQQAIFDAFQQPETLDDCIFIAFSKKIADELEARGLTSSTAIISINFSIPAVVGVPRGADQLADGMDVTVDPDAGVVYEGLLTLK